jgi:hypothetical protein
VLQLEQMKVTGLQAGLLRWKASHFIIGLIVKIEVSKKKYFSVQRMTNRMMLPIA